MRDAVWTLLLMTMLACTGKAPQNAVQDGTDTDTAEQPGQSPEEPTACTESSGAPDACECSTTDGFTTYRFQQDGGERCLTTYVDPGTNLEPQPLVMLPDCYTRNALQNPDAVMDFSQRYNVRSIELTAPSGSWNFPLNNEVNADNYTAQCDPESSIEVAYMQGVFSVVDQMVADGTVDPERIYVSGFSQNAMFSLFVATCFPERVRGINQGGSGLYSQADGSLALPQCEGACRRSDFVTHGDECVNEAPCDSCSYFPVYPDSSAGTFQSCIFMYDNDDAAHTTAVPAHKVLTEAGYEASLHIFASRRENGLGGHTLPVLGLEWANSCLNINPRCTSACEKAVVSCIDDFQDAYANDNEGQQAINTEEGRNLLSRVFKDCRSANPDICSQGCAATQAMLHSVQPPACVCAPGQADCDCTTSDVPGPCQNR